MLVAVLATNFATLRAQEGFQLGVVAGMNMSKFSTEGMSNKVGFHAGVKGELGLPSVSNGVYLDFAALLSLKGAKIDAGDLFSIKYDPYYLEVPIHIGYKYAVTENFSVLANAGPYVALGLFGKGAGEVNEAIGESGSGDIFGDGGMKRFDYGIGVKIGAEIIKKVQVQVGYDFGLAKASEMAGEIGEAVDFNIGMKNRNLTLSVAYMF